MDEIAPHAAEALAAYEAARKPANDAINALKAEISETTINAVIETMNAMSTAAVQYGIIEGGRQQNERYIHKADVMKEAAGTFIFSRQEFESSRVSLMGEHSKLVLQAQSAATRVSLMLQSIFNTKSKSRKLKRINQLAQTINEYVHINSEAAMMAGALAEDMGYLKRLDAGIRAAGGEKSIEPMTQAAL
jgi:hypothetical protein